MPSPFFQISAGGKDITSKLAGGQISLTIKDGVGLDADTAQIEIDDMHGVIAPPKTGVELKIIAGYVDDRVNFGTFTVDEVTLSGWPQKISISAQSAKAKSALKEGRPKSYDKEDYPTFKDVFAEIAGRHGLTLSISPEIGSQELEYEAQAEEDDISFLTRIGKKLDASISIKEDRLIAAKKGTGTSVSGQPLPFIVVRRGHNLLTYSVSRKDKPKHKKVKATWYNRKKAKREEVTANASADGPDFLIRAPAQSKAEAQKQANSKANELKRAEAKASFSVEGNPHARAEAHVIASNIRSMVDGVWRSVTVTHNWTSGGPYTTSIECELPK
ncbi:late control protein D [Mesorhizobium sp. NBSH29]|uniref:phage late control D family protein n=1 Tax=Mesorhizobium sp. NBSH29 TaxID=2654249 RepID=UPI0018967EDC|nr:contractile injection system protein, VgrG/Pvc8 family [Mesorhizobium sp. NBSH29]QPC87151.1 late control protein D [Mesorhizobium sp. NBSH29]